ncbi:MAG: hypothetical protein EYC70_10930 [Planctomycetota bacterium]|nr:MAG: hypothetical protein EYC70_10930 [Planctomycetota bacterium]
MLASGFLLLAIAPQGVPAQPWLDAARSAAERSVVLKLDDALAADARDGVLLGVAPEVAAVAQRLGGLAVERYFTQSPAELAELRLRGLGRGAWPPPPDLSLYFRVSTETPAAAAALAEELRRLPGVAYAYVAPAPADPPTDIPPVTPDWTQFQDYFEAPTRGTRQYALAGFLGARGRNVRVTDCEYAWVYDHEDIELNAGRLVGGTPVGLFSDHGTAVLGQLYAQDNDYGVTGGVPQCEMYMATEYATQFGFNPTQAIINAALSSQAGDVILLEMQTSGPTGAYVPEEWTQASFDAIQSATAAGIHVVEAGGNGGMNLDSAVFGGAFDVTVRDSRAVIVGAGSAMDHISLWFTSRGSRVDCQGWGESVYTAGYGNLFQAGSDDRQDYTSNFSGTSSASPIVTSAVVALQGAMEAHGMTPPTPLQLRDALRVTGTPQPPLNAAMGRIGPLPDLEALFDWFGLPQGLRHGPRAVLGGLFTLELSGNPSESWTLYRALDTALTPTPQGMRVLGSNHFASVASGSLSAAGTATYTTQVPNRSGLAGREAYLQALFGSARWSNGGAVTLE